MRPGLLLLILGAVVAAASPAFACRSYRPPTEAEIRERRSLLIARVESVERFTTDGVDHVRVRLLTGQRMAGQPEPVNVAQAYFGAGRLDIIISDCSQGHPLASELDLLIVGDEVVVETWRYDAGTVVTYAARRDRPNARLLLNRAY